VSSGDIKTSWISEWERVEKPWGFEMMWPSCSGDIGKLLFINEGERTSFKYNTVKSETLIVLSGKILAIYGNETFSNNKHTGKLKEAILTTGMILNIQSDCPYRLEALVDTKLIEIGNSKSSKAIIIEDDYGRTSHE